MQPLATTRRMMTWLSMCPAEESSNARQKAAFVAYTLAVLCLNLIGFGASIVFCFKYIKIDFNGATFAFMCAFAAFGVIYLMIAAILMCHQIESIFTSLSTIYKSNENEPAAFRYLARANNTSEWMWTAYMKYVAMSIGSMAIGCLLSVLYCYLTQGDFDANYFYRPTKFVLPWDQTTHLGYFAEICTLFPILFSYFMLNGTPLIFFISLCLHHHAFYKMFKHKIDESKKCDAELLSDLTRFHILVKDLFSDSANVYSPFILVQLICNTVFMTVSVFYLDLQWHDLDFMLASIMASTSAAISNLFIYCYFGKLATESYEMMSDCVYNMEWYEQPNELQKNFILMIANMQKPVYYHGFEVAKLDLRTFIKLCHNVFSYYMVIKTLAAK